MEQTQNILNFRFNGTIKNVTCTKLIEYGLINTSIGNTLINLKKKV